jgi:hypothetical protein
MRVLLCDSGIGDADDGTTWYDSRGRDLKKAAALRRNSGDEIRPSFLGREPHFGSINEVPVAKANFIEGLLPGA